MVVKAICYPLFSIAGFSLLFFWAEEPFEELASRRLLRMYGDFGAVCLLEAAIKLVVRRARPPWKKQSTFICMMGERFSTPSGHTLRAAYTAAIHCSFEHGANFGVLAKAAEYGALSSLSSTASRLQGVGSGAVSVGEAASSMTSAVWQPSRPSLFVGFCVESLAKTLSTLSWFSGLSPPTVLGALLVAWAAAVGWSRVALGKHYLSDVIIGAVLGGCVAWSGYPDVPPQGPVRIALSSAFAVQIAVIASSSALRREIPGWPFLAAIHLVFWFTFPFAA